MVQPQSPYTRIAHTTIQHYLTVGHAVGLAHHEIPPELYTIQRGCFVSLHLLNDDLRGCMGTIEPQEDNLVEEIQRNALSAAFHDHRFAPLTIEDFHSVKISVDVLTIPEKITSPEELDPLIFGLIISDGKYQRGVLLPSIPGIDTVEQQVRIVKRKAGLEKADDRGLTFYRFTSNRYH